MVSDSYYSTYMVDLECEVCGCNIVRANSIDGKCLDCNEDEGDIE